MKTSDSDHWLVPGPGRDGDPQVGLGGNVTGVVPKPARSSETSKVVLRLL